MEEKEAWLALNLIKGLSSRRIVQLVNHFGSAEKVLATGGNEFLRLEGFGPKSAKLIEGGSWRESLEKELNLLQKTGANYLTIAENDYPKLLKETFTPPVVLYYLGNKDLLKKSHLNLSVVGSRQHSIYGLRMTHNICGAAAHCGWSVISGLALGIDAAAHQTALEFNGPTIAVLGSGLGRIYPQENMKLAREIIAKGGLLLSEFPILTGPDRYNFPMRNRIIAGMSPATLVVEAGLNSGSLITANFANEQGRTVFAVPGPADSPNSQGCHKLLRDGAVLTESFDDIIDEFSLLPKMKKTKESLKEESEGLHLTELEQKILSIIDKKGVHMETISEQLDCAPGKIFAALILLETKRLIRALPGQSYELR